MVGGHALRAQRVLLASVGVERDRLRRPAYPRGYMRMGVGDHLGREPHEGEEAFQRDPVRQP